MLKNTDVAIKIGQSRETGNTEYTGRTQSKQKHNIIRVITKLPNSEQFYKGKVKTHKYQTDKISQQPEKCENCYDPDLVQAFLKKWWV